MQAQPALQTIGQHSLGGADEFVAAFGTAGAKYFASPGGGHAGAKADMFGTSSFIGSVSR